MQQVLGKALHESQQLSGCWVRGTLPGNPQAPHPGPGGRQRPTPLTPPADAHCLVDESWALCREAASAHGRPGLQPEAGSQREARGSAATPPAGGLTPTLQVAEAPRLLLQVLREEGCCL